MKEVYVKPQWYLDEFCLSEHVAKGCGTITTVVPGESVYIDRLSCAQVADKAFGTGGQGHWDAEGITVYDDNKNGVIDWEEIVRYVGTAQNGNVTGSGHNGHEMTISIPGVEKVTVVPENS